MNNNKMNKFVLILLIICLITIFIMSSLPIEKSNTISMGIGSKINEKYNIKFNNLNYIIRKSGHILSYMLVAILLYLFLEPRIQSKLKLISLVLVLGITFAGIDEYHQTFVKGRSGQVSDVFIDLIGMILGILTVLILKRVQIVLRKNKK